MVTKAQREAARRYNARTVQFVFRFNPDHDADVIQRLKQHPSKTEYIRQLVRRDIRNGQEQ